MQLTRDSQEEEEAGPGRGRELTFKRGFAFSVSVYRRVYLGITSIIKTQRKTALQEQVSCIGVLLSKTGRLVTRVVRLSKHSIL